MKSVPAGVHFAESCPYRGTVPNEKCSGRGTFRIEMPLQGALYLMKSVPGGVHFAESCPGRLPDLMESVVEEGANNSSSGLLQKGCTHFMMKYALKCNALTYP